MTTKRDFGPMAGEIRNALDNYSREELADLLAHIVRVFVIEGGGPTPEASKTGSTGDLSSLSFSQLILHLKMNLPHRELQRLVVSGARVWVDAGGREVDLTDPPAVDEQPPDPMVVDRNPEPQRDDPFSANDPPFQEMAPAATGPVTVQSEVTPGQPGAFRPRRSGGSSPGTTAEDAGRVERPNVGLRGPQSEPPAQPAPAAQPPRRDWLADEMAPGKDDREDQVDDMSDRFSMLELD